MKYLVRIILLLITFTLLFVMEKAVFALIYGAATGAETADITAAVVWHGLSMDFSAAAYLTALPLLASIVEVWWRGKAMQIISTVYFAIVSILLAVIFTLDIMLYSYWGFRLDSTPLFYFLSSPSAALASVTAVQAVAGVAGVMIIAAVIFMLLRTVDKLTVLPSPGKRNYRMLMTGVLVIAGGLLFIIMRGGVTVSTMNLSRAYFSTNSKLNHIAVNPLHSLIYSISRQSNFGEQFNFYSEKDVAESLSLILKREGASQRDTTVYLINKRPDIYVIILESFSSHLFPTLGGDSVASGLDSIARKGVSWSRAYATGFRTDRGIPAVLSGFPTQPTLSVMKYVDKAERLPSLAKKLKDELGYSTSYYYGGDANFTNMLAYLVSQGYDKIISDKDFPLTQKASKWGAHDGVLLDKMLADMKTWNTSEPRLTVIQTSSSHEPFEVPYSNPRFVGKERRNAFAYTDSCVTSFIGRIESTRRGKNSLFVIVPDHYGAWPLRDSLPSLPQCHHIPMILYGSALRGGGKIMEKVASQTDLAATLLSMMGLRHDEFAFSRDLLDEQLPGSAWIAQPDRVGLITDEGYIIYNIENEKIVEYKGSDELTDIKLLKSYLQYLYDEVERLDKK